MLFIEPALRQRIDTLYRADKVRAKKHGVYELPFTKAELWDHVYAQVGPSAIRCPYCEEIGRPANLITLANCVLDHVVPVTLTRGGSFALSNVRCCCAQCNTEKGEFSYEFFISLVTAIERWHDLLDRAAALTLLRSQGVVAQTRKQQWAQQKQGKTARPLPPVTKRGLPLAEDF